MSIYLHIILRSSVSLFFVGLLHLPWAIEVTHLLQTEEVHMPCEEQATHFHEACLDCELFDCLLPLTYTPITSEYTSQNQLLSFLKVEGFSIQRGFINQLNNCINGLRGPPEVSRAHLSDT